MADDCVDLARPRGTVQADNVINKTIAAFASELRICTVSNQTTLELCPRSLTETSLQQACLQTLAISVWHCHAPLPSVSGTAKATFIAASP